MAKEEKKPKEEEKVEEDEDVELEDKDTLPEVPEGDEEEPDKEKEEEVKELKKKTFEKEGWAPKTELGKLVHDGKITHIDQILNSGMRILEAEVVDFLMPNLESDLLLIGQSKGKFGGGQRRVFKQTQKKTREGNKPNFACLAVVGNKDGYVGIGYGKAKETVPAREKAFRNAKLNIFKIRRGAGSWEDASQEPHSVPFAVDGKSGSVIIRLMPAPKGTGLVADSEVAKVLELAGIKNIWSKTRGQRKVKINVIKALEKALRKLTSTKIQPGHIEALNIVEGNLGEAQNE